MFTVFDECCVAEDVYVTTFDPTYMLLLFLEIVQDQKKCRSRALVQFLNQTFDEGPNLLVQHRKFH